MARRLVVLCLTARLHVGDYSLVSTVQNADAQKQIVRRVNDFMPSSNLFTLGSIGRHRKWEFPFPIFP